MCLRDLRTQRTDGQRTGYVAVMCDGKTRRTHNVITFSPNVTEFVRDAASNIRIQFLRAHECMPVAVYERLSELRSFHVFLHQLTRWLMVPEHLPEHDLC